MIQLSPPSTSVYPSIVLPESHSSNAKGKITYYVEPFSEGYRILWVDRISKSESIFYSSCYRGGSWEEPLFLLSRNAAVSLLTAKKNESLSYSLVTWREKTDQSTRKVAEVFATTIVEGCILETVRISHEGVLVTSLDLAIVADGSKAVLTWDQVGDKTSQIFASTFEKSRFSHPMLISNSERFSTNPSVVYREDGIALIRWEERLDVSTTANPDTYLIGVGGGAILNDSPYASR
jgi:hypothetical protein